MLDETDSISIEKVRLEKGKEQAAVDCGGLVDSRLAEVLPPDAYSERTTRIESGV